jgi:signal transduction histidine kinase/CheY-like chemotaxis protein
MATPPVTSAIATCASLTAALSKTRTADGIYAAALDALQAGLGVERASILLFDPDGVMRFKAFRGISEAYRRAVEGHTPWTPDSPDPQPIVVPDVRTDPALAGYEPVFTSERIAAMAFIPLVSLDRVIGKFMLYFGEPGGIAGDALQLALVIAGQVAFAVERTRSEEEARRSAERLHFALDAASMGTWDWDLRTNEVQWSDNLADIHGLPPGAFDGTFASYEREIHPDDRPRVFASVQRALSEKVPHDVEYRIVAPDGTVRWCEGKGRVEYLDGRPARMSGVCMIVTRRKEAELARLEAAEESGRVKDQFLATLSHELRTPLNAILGWVQMLQKGEVPPAQAKLAIDVVARNARLQAQLIDDILDVSRIVTGKLEIERTPVSVAQVLETVCADIAPAVAAKHLTLTTHLADNLAAIEGDPKRLHQIFNNVLSNAVKFTPEGGLISLSCRADGERVRIEVRDSGIGIEPEFLPYIFDRFRQADSRSTRTHGGLGLGLAIARHLVEPHGGTISARSDGAGKGTTISIDFPAMAAGGTETTVEAERPAHHLRFDDAVILVVDDQQDSREMLAVMLQHRGATVLQSDSAEAALRLLATRQVDLVIADIAMPGVDGYELMRRLREAGVRTPAIAVTAYARPEDFRQALECGYISYLPKPVDAARLAEEVHDIVARNSRSRTV